MEFANPGIETSTQMLSYSFEKPNNLCQSRGLPIRYHSKKACTKKKAKIYKIHDSIINDKLFNKRNDHSTKFIQKEYNKSYDYRIK